MGSLALLTENWHHSLRPRTTHWDPAGWQTGITYYTTPYPGQGKPMSIYSGQISSAGTIHRCKSLFSTRFIWLHAATIDNATKIKLPTALLSGYNHHCHQDTAILVIRIQPSLSSWYINPCHQDTAIIVLRIQPSLSSRYSHPCHQHTAILVIRICPSL